MADQVFQTFPRVLMPLSATFTTFLVCRISLVVNIVKGCKLIEGVYLIRGNYFFVMKIFKLDKQLIG